MMGRVKLKIRRLENTNGRQATYAKRKNGIMKKANELSILCDIDIALLMFSPNGKLSLCSGKRSSIEEVIAKFAQVTPQERAKRKLESLEALRKTFKKLDHDVNIQDFLGRSSQGIEDLTNQARMLQTQLSEMQRRLSHWTNPQNIESTEHLEQMEDSLRESLKRIRTCKENFSKQQLMSFDADSQFPNGIHIPLRVGVDQEFQPLSWIPNNESQSIVLPKGPNLFPQRDLDFHASSSFGSYFGNFGNDKRLQINHSSQESGVVNEPSAATSLGVEASGKHFYPFYALNSMSNTKPQPVAEISVQESSLDYHMDGSFCAPQPEFDTTGGSWTSTLQPCAVAAFNEHLYSQSS